MDPPDGDAVPIRDSHPLVGELRRGGELPYRRQLVREGGAEPHHAVGAAHDALEAAGLDSVVKGVARDAHASSLGRGEDALRLGELGDLLYVVRILHVAIAGCSLQSQRVIPNPSPTDTAKTYEAAFGAGNCQPMPNEFYSHSIITLPDLSAAFLFV